MSDISELLNNLLTSWGVVMAFVVLVLYQSIHIAHESERFAKFLLGRFVKYEGPGLVLTTSPMRLVRLRIGDVGILTSREFANFGGADVPIKNAESLSVGASVR